jgi:truncated hemoglobin YjbI
MKAVNEGVLAEEDRGEPTSGRNDDNRKGIPMRGFCWLLLVITASLLMTGRGAGAAEDREASPPGQEAQDERVHAVLEKLLWEARDLFNNGDPAAANFFLQGAVKGLDPFLDYRPGLQTALRDGMTAALKLVGDKKQAWALWFTVHDAYKATNPRLPTLMVGKGATLWERMGEEKGVTKIVHEFVKGCLENEKVNLTRGGKYLKSPEDVEKLERNIVLLTSAFGKGPLKWAGKTMKKAHEDMGITDDEFDHMRAVLKTTLLKNGLPRDDVDFILYGIDSIRSDIVAKAAAAPPPDRTLWDRLGGEAGVRELVKDLLDTVINNPKVNFSRNGVYKMTDERVKELNEKFVALTSAIGKGPYPYKGKSMLAGHKDMGITDDEFDHFLQDLDLVLRRHKVQPGDIVLIRKLMDNIRKDIVENPRKADSPPADAKRTQASPSEPPAIPRKPDTQVADANGVFLALGIVFVPRVALMFWLGRSMLGV